MARPLAMATRGKLNPTTEELCYLAGVVDSDGCISIGKMKAGMQRTKNPRYVLMLNVTNTSKELMEWLTKTFGGSYKARRKAKEHHKITYSWLYNNARASKVLSLIEPYLIIKKDRAILGQQFIAGWVTEHNGPGTKTGYEEVARREQFYQMMKQVNQVGERSRND